MRARSMGWAAAAFFSLERSNDAGGAAVPHAAGLIKGTPAAVAPQSGFPTVGITK